MVNDLELDAANNALYVGGDFTLANGVARSGLAKLDATTGELITTFKAPSGKINDLMLVNVGGTERLFAGGPGKGLVSLNPVTGKRDTYGMPCSRTRSRVRGGQASRCTASPTTRSTSASP